MRGVESQAMVLCANNEDGSLVELVQPPAGSKPGDRVFLEGDENGKYFILDHVQSNSDLGTPDAQLQSKEKVWETIQPLFKTNASRQASYVGADGKECLMKTSTGVCQVKSIVGGGLK